MQAMRARIEVEDYLISMWYNSGGTLPYRESRPTHQKTARISGEALPGKKIRYRYFRAIERDPARLITEGIRSKTTDETGGLFHLRIQDTQIQ